jgi:uncharacterized membrane protein YkvA (DUF1232 family)
MHDSPFSKPFTPDEIEAMRRMARASESSLSQFWQALRRIARNLPFASDLLAAYLAVKDPQTPPRVRLLLAGALAYFILPFDTMPDFLPFLGFSDDMALLAVTLATVGNAITPGHREKARTILESDDGSFSEI